MKVLRILFALGIVFTLAGFTSYEPKERLWISFSGSKTRFDASIRKYLMTIDALGNVITPPFRVSELGQHRNTFLAALSLNGSHRLNLWYLPFNPSNHVARIVLNKETFKEIKWVRTDISAKYAIADVQSTFDVTNRKDNNFISVLTSGPEGMQVIAHKLNHSGQATGETFVLTPPLSGEVCAAGTRLCKGGTTANGRLVYWIEQDSANLSRMNLFIRPLAASGEPILNPVLIDRIISHVHFYSFTSADATGRLAGGKRFLIYTKEPPRKKDSLLLQQIDATTGNNVGTATTLLEMELSGNVRIDPKGRFVLFLSADERFGLGLAYLALDATGHASGAPKILSNLAVQSIDLLREDLTEAGMSIGLDIVKDK